MLVADRAGERVVLDFFVEAAGRGADPGRRAELVAIDVSFGDADQVFNIGPASVGVLRHAGGHLRRPRAPSARCRSADLAGPAARLAREGVPLNARAGLRGRDPRRHRDRRARVRAPSTRPRAACCGEGDPVRQPELADDARAPGRRGAAPVLPRRHRAGDRRLAVRARRAAHARGPRGLPRGQPPPDRAALPRPRRAAQPAAVGRRHADRVRARAARARRPRRAHHRAAGRGHGGGAGAAHARVPRRRWAERGRPLGLDHAHLRARRRRPGLCRDHVQRRGLGDRRPRHRDSPQQHARRAGPEPARLPPPPTGAAAAEHDVPDRRAARRPRPSSCSAAGGPTGSGRPSCRP